MEKCENYVTLLESGAGWIEPVAQESVVDSALLRVQFKALQNRILVHKLYTNPPTAPLQ